MKFEITRLALHKALHLLRNASDKKSKVPILSCVLIEASNAGSDIIRLTTTDMELMISMDVAARVIEPGRLALPASTLFDIVAKQKDGAVLDITSTAGGASVKAGRNVTALNGDEVDDFPATAGGEAGACSFDIPARDLLKLIDRCRFAMSSEETRYYLNGFYFHVANRGGEMRLCATATDGHRLADIACALPDGAASMPAVIVPRRSVGEIRKVAEAAGETLRVSVSASRLRIEGNGVVAATKLIDGTFPEYERVIPRDNPTSLLIDRKPFMEAVHRVVAIGAERTKPVKIDVSRTGIILSHVDENAGSATEEIAPDEFTFSGDGVIIGFQARYLADIGDALGDRVEFKLGDSGAPALLLAPGDNDARFVLMPMRV